MATFTIVLKDVVEMENGNVGLDDYPIFDKDYRELLNEKILDHYWNQEIGMETVSMFRHAMKRRMNEIMPLYNQHYLLSLMQVDPLSTMSIKSITRVDNEGTGASEVDSSGTSETDANTTSAQNKDATGTSGTKGSADTSTASESASENSSASEAASRAVASDTPQTALQADADYATSMQDSTSQSTGTGSATDSGTVTTAGTNTEDTETVANEQSTLTSEEKAKQLRLDKTNQTSSERSSSDQNTSSSGYQGHAPMLILQARQALVNVDMLIIEELQDLFMLIWSTNDSYTNFNRYGYARYGSHSAY